MTSNRSTCVGFVVILILLFVLGYATRLFNLVFLVGGFLTLVVCVGMRSGKYIASTAKSTILIEDDRVGIPRDPSFIHRVVRDVRSGQEVVVSGLPKTTFRDACLRDWPFRRISKKSEWLIKDERGNDISNQSLSDYDGIATIEAFVEGAPEQYESGKAETEDRYSTHDDAVEYYD